MMERSRNEISASLVNAFPALSWDFLAVVLMSVRMCFVVLIRHHLAYFLAVAKLDVIHLAICSNAVIMCKPSDMNLNYSRRSGVDLCAFEFSCGSHWEQLQA